MNKLSWLSWGAVTLMGLGLLWEFARPAEGTKEVERAMALNDPRRKQISEARESNSALRKITKRWKALGRTGRMVARTTNRMSDGESYTKQA